MEEISVILDLVETEVGWKSFASAGRYLAIYRPLSLPGGIGDVLSYGLTVLQHCRRKHFLLFADESLSSIAPPPVGDTVVMYK